MSHSKPQRIRDPVHNLIEFGSDQFENMLWRVIQTQQFQRLRRIRQLGFSEFVFPGATHTRFAHSIGVFHTARQLIKVIERNLLTNPSQQYRPQQAQHALAAALLHDIGHGMFSHAFEGIGKEFNWKMARHEDVSQLLIRDSDVSGVLDREFGGGFSGNVADVIAQEMPNNLYGSIVSSQFDADRLDYMQRDRLMTGVQSSSVDPTWLLANLEVGEIASGVDDSSAGFVQTLILGPKAVHAAESYVLSLFHLYPNVYLHKTTRGAEKIFQLLMRRVVQLYRDGLSEHIGLTDRHPIMRFVEDPKNLEKALALDDTVFWGSLPMLIEAPDEQIQKLSRGLRDRYLFRCIDIRRLVEKALAPSVDRIERGARLKLCCEIIVKNLEDHNKNVLQSGVAPRFLIDQYARNPYKKFQDSKSPLNQILIRGGDGKPADMADFSPIIAHAEPFNICRAYVFRDDKDAESVIANEIGTSVRGIV
jgi:HD superfamily phosphohydrolase